MYQQGRGRVVGRVMAVTAEEAEASGDVLIAPMLVYSHPALALFDSEATNCFISSCYVA